MPSSRLLSSKHPVIAHGPLPRYADNEAEKKFKRTITNARKKPQPKKHHRIIKSTPVARRHAKK